MSEEKEVAEILNDFFKNAVSTIEINENRFLLHGNDNLENPVERAISKFSLHPSILEIKNRTQSISGFSFCEVTLEDMEAELKHLDSNKANTFKNIPVKQLKQTSEIICHILQRVWNNEIIKNKTFPSKLKYADITPIFKREDPTLAKNYRPVSVLPVISKIFERLMLK